MRVLVFNIIWYDLSNMGGNITCTYVLVIDRTCSSLYEVKRSIKKYLSCNLIRYIIQQRDDLTRSIPNNQLSLINNLFSLNFGTSEVISLVKERLSHSTKSMQRVGYIYEVDI